MATEVGGVSATALDIAKYFVAKADENDELMSHLKLQKLLYYAQGFHLAVNGAPLFREDVLHWEHGPVVREAWNEYSDYRGGIPIPHDGEVPEFDDDTRELLDDVWRVYGQFSAWRLREMSHDTPPWKDTQVNAVIPLDAMQSYFKTELI